MKYCQNCGNKINQSTRFCPYCGAKQVNNMRDSKIVSNKQIKHTQGNGPTSVNWLWLTIGYILPIFAEFVYYVLWLQPSFYNSHIMLNLETHVFSVIIGIISLIIACVIHHISHYKNYTNEYFKYADKLLIILSILIVINAFIIICAVFLAMNK